MLHTAVHQLAWLSTTMKTSFSLFDFSILGLGRKNIIKGLNIKE